MSDFMDEQLEHEQNQRRKIPIPPDEPKKPTPEWKKHEHLAYAFFAIGAVMMLLDAPKPILIGVFTSILVHAVVAWIIKGVVKDLGGDRERSL